MSIKPIEPTNKHPEGGYWIKYTVRKGAKFYKSEKRIWVEDYPNAKAAEMAAKAEETNCYNNALAKAEGKLKELKEAQEKAKTNVWTLERVAMDRIEKYGNTSMGSYFREIIRLAGQTLPEDYEDAYWNTINHLRDTPALRTNKERSDATINRYKAVFRIIFNHAFSVGAIDKDHNLARDFDYDFDSEDERDIVWNEDQKAAVFKAMEELESWLYHAVHFASYNPIRAGDLFGDEKRGNPGLRKTNWNPVEHWVQFIASKTGGSKKAGKSKKRLTILKQIDQTMVSYFESLPKNCVQLFPRISKDGIAYPVKVYKEEWARVINKANGILKTEGKETLDDFHFHDLKHCAITYLLDNGYTEMDLKQCGIQYSDAMIKRYYHFNAKKAPVLPGFEKKEKPVLKLHKEAV